MKLTLKADPDISPAPAADTAPKPRKLTEPRQAAVEVQVIKAARNKQYVYASLDGERVSVLCRSRDRDRVLGKRIRVLVSERDGQKFYEHQP